MKRLLALCAFATCFLLNLNAQVLSLDSCRQMALRNNKQLGIARQKQQIAKNTRKAAHTKYLPHIDIAGGWMLSSKEVSILNDHQKDVLSNLGSTTFSGLGSDLGPKLADMAAHKIITEQQAEAFGGIAGAINQQLVAMGNSLGGKIKDAFRTDTRSIIAGSVMVNQPVYLGGALTATNNIAEIMERMADTSVDAAEQDVMYDIDKNYWLVVSLRQKQRLADSYLKLISKLDDDVHKMIREGVATKADGLKVDVKVNEAEMAKTQVDNGLSLARMLLCQTCGLPIDSDITLTDESMEDIPASPVNAQYDHSIAESNRPELQLLNDAIGITEQTTKLIRAARLPQVALTAGYLVSNPNLFNGYEKKWGGMWNLGLLVRIPVLDWGENMYKVRATKVATNIAHLEYDEAKEKIDLQVSLYDYRLSEANKRLLSAQKNISRAEENLRCANLGFSEGVIDATEVMAAQTAWMQAQTQKIDAQIDVRLCEAGMKKVLGIR